jgi:hypothetical protein
MTEQTIDQIDAAGTPPEPTPTPAPKATAATSEDKAVRYSAYDRTYLRFVGGVHDSKAKAKAAAKDKGSTDVEIREV